MKIGDLVFLKYKYAKIIIKIKRFTINTRSVNKFTFYGTALWDNERKNTIPPPLRDLHSYSYYSDYSIYDKETAIEDILFIEEL